MNKSADTPTGSAAPRAYLPPPPPWPVDSTETISKKQTTSPAPAAVADTELGQFRADFIAQTQANNARFDSIDNKFDQLLSHFSDSANDLVQQSIANSNASVGKDNATNDPKIDLVVAQIRQYEKGLITDPPTKNQTKSLTDVDLPADPNITFKDTLDGATNLSHLYTIQRKLIESGIKPNEWMEYLRAHFSPQLNLRYAALSTCNKRSYSYGVAFLLQTYPFQINFWNKQDAFRESFSITNGAARKPWTWFASAVSELAPYKLLDMKAQFMTAFAIACDDYLQTLPHNLARQFQSIITIHRINDYMVVSNSKKLNFSTIHATISDFYAECQQILNAVSELEQTNAVRHSSSSNYKSNYKSDYRSKSAYKKPHDRPQKPYSRQRNRTNNASSTKRSFCSNCSCANCAVSVKKAN